MDAIWRFDNQIFRAIDLGWRQAWLDPIFWALSYSGLGQVQAIALLSLLFFEKAKRFVLPLLVAESVAGFIFCDITKVLVPRDRPSNLFYAIHQEDLFGKSFPSGHTSSSFGIAFMLLYMTRKTPHAWVGWLAIMWAAAVGLSRIYRGVHWPTDVLAGICMGLAGASTTYFLFNYFDWWRKEEPAIQTQS